MSDLDVVIIACVLANAAGLGAASLMVYCRRAMPVGPGLLSFVVGVLLGAVLLDLLPHLWEATGNLVALLGMFAAALLASRLFDSACACNHRPIVRHASEANHHHGGQDATPTRGTELLLVGDFVHSLVDGALIVAALAVGVVPGAVATMAVAIHEVPRRIATVTLLVRAGCRPVVALGLAVCAGMGTVLGGTLAWWSAEAIRPALPVALALSAAAMLYVALAQSAQIVGTWRARVLTLECSLPFLAGVFIIGGSHHALELFG
jgi:zinc and cadmium transporter